MREIKFRGKRVDDGQWVYGGIDIMQGDTTIFDHSDMLHSQVEVDEETIGQYTGLDDKNGKKIYEGDIVKLPYCNNDIATVEDDISKYYLRSVKDGGTYGIGLIDPKYFEVLGNIHDNPELLK